MITVDKAKGICKMYGTGLELAMDIANIVAGLCKSTIEQREPGTSKHEAMEGAEMLLYASVSAGIAEALASVGATEEDADDAE